MIGSANRSAPSLEKAVAEASTMIEEAVRALVMLSERVIVRESIEGEVGMLILYVDAFDPDRVTGPAGRTQQSLRIVLQAMARKSGVSLSLQIEARNP
jgi:predicted RNA-binding protein YlqC (UPF0109 family)